MKHRPQVAKTILIAALAALSTVLPDGAGRAQGQAELGIELNKMEATEQGCKPVFLFDNATGHQLNRFEVELVLFDTKGIYSKQVLLNMAPVYKGKQVLASFLLQDMPCDGIGRILVNALPACANSTGDDLDCVAMLKVSSRAEVPLEK
jgi:hypothetical protein